MRIICSNGLVYDSNNYLSHHGIQGQKWGRKNGPPYPLAAGDHSASEKKAGWRDSLNSSGSKHTKNASSKSAGQKSNKVHKTLRQRIHDMTPEQKAKAKKIAKRVLIAAGAVAVTAVSAQVGFEIWKKITTDKLVELGRKHDSLLKNDLNLGRELNKAFFDKEDALKALKDARSSGSSSAIIKRLERSLQSADASIESLEDARKANLQSIFDTQRKISDYRFDLNRFRR